MFASVVVRHIHLNLCRIELEIQRLSKDKYITEVCVMTTSPCPPTVKLFWALMKSAGDFLHYYVQKRRGKNPGFFWY